MNQLPPVNRLPVGILSEYLLLANEDRVPALSPQEAPLLFLKICHRWHDVALSTPRLWSRVLVLADNIARDDLETAFREFDDWLSRSGTLPLSCYVKDYRGGDRSRDTLFAIVLRRAPRLRDFYFNCISTPKFSSTMPLFPILRSASLLYEIGIGPPLITRTPENAPALDFVALNAFHVKDCPDILAERLTRLCIMEKAAANSPDVFFRLTRFLLKLSKLEYLAIGSIGGDNLYEDDPAGSLPPLNFPASLNSSFAISVDAPLGSHTDSALSDLFESHPSTLKSLTYHFTYSLSELRVRDSSFEYDASILEDPKDYYHRKYESYGSLWTSASSIESFILCDHTDCSISFLECLIALIFRFDPNGSVNAIEGCRSMPRLWDFTIQIRLITSEWYLQRFATIRHNILDSRVRFRELALAGMLPQIVSSSDFESLRRRARLRIIFIVEPSDVSNHIMDTTDTSSNAHCDSDLPESYECIDYCTSVIREKLQRFVSPSQTHSCRPEQCLDLSFEVLRQESHMCCGEEGLEQPYDTRFLPTRATL